ncbi:MAG: FliH/SctL family protein [Alphaproteobacteria bacterium]|nr:FliH/SctL family protein [Alphaproteobacteria bacterium]
MSLAGAKPFLFETSFDVDPAQRRREAQEKKEQEELRRAEEAAARLAAEPPAPTYSEEELQAAKAQAWQEGHDTGLSDALAQREARIAEILEALSAQIGGLHVHQDVANERLSLQLTETALQLVRRLMPSYSAAHGLDEIKSVLTDCMERLAPDSRLTVSVSDENRALLEPQLAAMAARSGFEGRLSIVSDPELEPADVQARWDGGGLDRLESHVWESVEGILARARENLPSPLPPLAAAAEAAAGADPAPPAAATEPTVETVPESTHDVAATQAATTKAVTDAAKEAALAAMNTEPDADGEEQPSPNAGAEAGDGAETPVQATPIRRRVRRIHMDEE